MSSANKYPWMVALVTSLGGQFCGGTLVASKYVVTAAHCMFVDNELTTLQTVDNIKVIIDLRPLHHEALVDI